MMKSVGHIVKTLRAGEAGATAMEYALILGLVSLVIVSGIGLFGDEKAGNWSAIASTMKAAQD
ncbi:Flp family type IVb pilin [Altericroceibacterium spongiae]|uniref:Flp family type IVb pilin n=1 Tax=Altericroceibacterium spongiae TaxID=2320269 RepID=A0A420EF88_9SPHN|nr:Flp family type IVb pilin [Altericroceibacterium spongiae]RKF19330.1 Flp family type IVb pilin [Altericroceibacterium spongiae]